MRSFRRPLTQTNGRNRLASRRGASNDCAAAHGRQFEAGEVHCAHSVNGPEAAAMRDRMFADADSPAGIGIQSPQGAAAAATAHEDSPRVAARDRAREAEAEGQAYAPWLGKAEKLDVVGKLILSRATSKF